MPGTKPTELTVSVLADVLGGAVPGSARGSPAPQQRSQQVLSSSAQVLMPTGEVRSRVGRAPARGDVGRLLGSVADDVERPGQAQLTPVVRPQHRTRPVASRAQVCRAPAAIATARAPTRTYTRQTPGPPCRRPARCFHSRATAVPGAVALPSAAHPSLRRQHAGVRVRPPPLAPPRPTPVCSEPDWLLAPYGRDRRRQHGQ